MSRIGRKLSDAIIIDNSPPSYMFQPENGMPILSWYEDKEDTKLYELIPALKLLSQVNDVRPIILESTTKDNKFMIDKCIHLCERSIKEMQPTVPPPQMQYR
jgi:TFIIF-interacting CTD phosphatase-like protein